MHFQDALEVDGTQCGAPRQSGYAISASRRAKWLPSVNRAADADRLTGQHARHAFHQRTRLEALV